jgi:hypothetical protein
MTRVTRLEPYDASVFPGCIRVNPIEIETLLAGREARIETDLRARSSRPRGMLRS